MSVNRTYRVTIIGCLLMLLISGVVLAQVPFGCSSDVWMLESETDRLVTFRINPSNNAIQIIPFVDDAGSRIDAIAFNHGDGLLYGLNASTFELYTIDADGVFRPVTQLDLNTDYRYEVLTFDRDPNRLITVGSSGGLDRSIVLIDMSDYSIQEIGITGNIHVSDYSVDPYTGQLYGYNIADESILAFDLANLSFTNITIAQPGNAFQGVYLNSFGEAFAFGSTAGGIASALYHIEKGDVETRLSTGPESSMRDFANCPFRVDLTLEVDPKFTFPCNDIEYRCRISNASLSAIEGLSLRTQLPPGFRIKDIDEWSTDGDFDAGASSLEVRNLDLDGGIDSFRMKVEVQDIPEGFYFTSASVSGLDAFLGSEIVSDNPSTIRQLDETRVEIKRIDEDSIFINYFFCRDDEAVLEGQNFGAILKWEDGTTGPTLTVDDSGTYYLEARSGCQKTIVVFEVTIANCPFNIEVDHVMYPDSLFPCSEAEFQFIVNNDTGNEYEGIDFTDTLAGGFEFLEVLKNPFGGRLVEDEDSQVVLIEDMVIPDGIDTIRLLVYVGDINPSRYPNRAVVSNFPSNLGYFRLSDFPPTPELDSTYLTVMGVDSDTVFREEILCRGETITLDGRPYGFEFLWDNGSEEAVRSVDRIGEYELKVFSGCEVSYVIFDVISGDQAEVAFDPVAQEIMLGDSVQLFPEIYSENDSVLLEWIDPQDSTLSCMACRNPYARPYFDNIYTAHVSNGVCRDSAFMEISVDNTRRIYAPNIINIDAIDINQYFFLQSPDYGVIEELVVSDRWGRIVYRIEDVHIQNPDYRWDGWNKEGYVPSGVYMWQAKIRFLDHLSEVFSGSITVLR